MPSSSRSLPAGIPGAAPVTAGLALAAIVTLSVVDSELPTAGQWGIVGILAAVAVAHIALMARFGPADTASSPPWSVHTAWLLPAALLAPPMGFLPLLAISIAATSMRRLHSVAIRTVVATITTLGAVETRLAALLIDDVVIAALVSIAALYITGLIMALLAAYALTGPTGTALWLDYRWSLVQLACSFGGLLTAVAMELRPLTGLAAIAPVLLGEFALAWPELDRHARVDAKTGLPNARHWEDRSRDLLSAAQLHGTPISVAMVDIDHFKSVNDTYGHLVGDVVLQGLAAALRSQVTPEDVLGRFGGEEFVMTLVGLDAQAAGKVAERIRGAVAAQRHHGGRVGEYDDVHAAGAFTITCTVGIASAAGNDADLGVLLSAADAALARGKAAGRDRVEHIVVGEAGAPAVEPGPATAPADARFGAWAIATHKRSWRRVADAQQQRRRQSQKDAP